MQGHGQGSLAAGRRVIGFCSDFGLLDPYVGICHAVIAGLAPGALVIDLGHEIPPGDVRRGAALLAQAAPHLPRPAVVLAVVDPGVGTERAGLAVVCRDGSALVGPDNGVLGWAGKALGGIESAYVITNSTLFRHPVSATFHGRDVFAPVAARLASGLDPAEVGPGLPLPRLVRLPDPVVTASAGELIAEVLSVDRYGNLQTAADLDQLSAAFGANLPATLRVDAGDAALTARVGTTYGSVDAGDPVVYLDSAALVAVAINRGSAAATLAAGPGDLLRLSYAHPTRSLHGQ